MFRRLYEPVTRHVRHASTKQKIRFDVTMNEETHDKIANGELKPRWQPGRDRSRTANLPEWMDSVLERVLEDMPRTTAKLEAEKFGNFLHNRRAPMEVSAVEAQYAAIKANLFAERKDEAKAGQPLDDLTGEEKKKSLQSLKRMVHCWTPVNYNKYAGLLYLLERASPEYAILCKVFNEIISRDQDFKPKTLFDFGSGIGTTIWSASQCWPRAVQEHVCVDISAEMNDLSETIIEHAKLKTGKVFYRQYVPLSNLTFDLVVSAYSLLELPNMQSRLETLEKLWAKTEKYLVIVERGTNAGFKIINEARDFILHMKKARNEVDLQPGGVFAPCPHQFRCPRSRSDDTPCNFELSYPKLQLGRKPTFKSERYSYVIFKKGEIDHKTKNWPVLVRPVLTRSKHAVCRMCTSDGKLTEIIFTSSKYGKWMYQCARTSRWGDRLPIEKITESVVEVVSRPKNRSRNSGKFQSEEFEETEETHEENDQKDGQSVGK